MELVQDLVWTASVALILSFFVAKLVAIATTDRDPAPPEFSVSHSVEEVLIRSQTKVEFVGEVMEVDRFEVEPAVEEVAEPEPKKEEVSAAVEDPEEVSGVVDSQRGGHEAAQIISEEMGEPNDVVFSDENELNEGKGKSEAIETEATKLESYSSGEDDWEGIEKSELDDGYVKSEGGS